jgi:hypothetical protein
MQILSALNRLIKASSQIILTPVLVVGVAALILYILGTLPAHLPSAQGGIKEYGSVEAASVDLGFEVVVPVYFPSYLSWPPDKILGQIEPFPMAQVFFLSSEARTEALLTIQIVSEEPDLPVPLPWLDKVEERMPVTINDITGELTVGRNDKGEVVNAVQWNADGQYFVLVTTAPVKELVSLARSMYPTR